MFETFFTTSSAAARLLIGAVGASAGTVAQDIAVAEAALAALEVNR